MRHIISRLVADGAIGKVDPAEHTAAAVLLQARVSRRASRPPPPVLLHS